LRYKYLPIFFNKHPTIHALTCHDLRPKKPTGSDSVSLEEVSSSGSEHLLRQELGQGTTGSLRLRNGPEKKSGHHRPGNTFLGATENQRSRRAKRTRARPESSRMANPPRQGSNFLEYNPAKEVLSLEAWNANSALTFYKLLKNLRQTAKLLPLVHPQTNVKYMVDWPFVEGDLERQAMPTYLGGQGAVNVALRKTINDLVYTYLIKLLTPCWPRIEKALVLTDYDDDASPQPHLNLQGASSPFHPQPRVPPFFFFPPPLRSVQPMLATYCFSGRLRTAIHPARRQLLFLCTMRPMPEAARVPGTPARGAPPCMRATSQRALAPAERLHPGQPMLACAQPRSGRPPLPSVKQRPPSRNLCTRGNPCLQRVLLRDPCARPYIPCPQCVLLRDPQCVVLRDPCACRLHAPRPRAVLQRALAPAVKSTIV
jgi:hypothetical protein